MTDPASPTGSGKNIVVIGATSAIAHAFCREYAIQGARFFLVARSSEKLETISSDLKGRGANEVDSLTRDFSKPEDSNSIAEQAEKKLGSIDLLVVAHGNLPDQIACQQNSTDLRQALEINFLSTAAVLHDFAKVFEKQRKGTIVAISSVAGDRGRQSNYVYGAAKGALSVFLSGLRHRLFPAGVTVVDIRPGFVDTPMTSHFPKGPLWAKPEQIAQGMIKAVEKKRAVVYLPWFWTFIMLVIRSVPNFIFLRSKL